MNHELPDVQAGFRKGRGMRDHIANICWIIEKAREFQKNIYFCFIDYAKAFDPVDHNKLWKILQEMGIPDHLTCLLRNLYAGQEATARSGLKNSTFRKLRSWHPVPSLHGEKWRNNGNSKTIFLCSKILQIIPLDSMRFQIYHNQGEYSTAQYFPRSNSAGPR